jgi:hypothetical protein
MMTDIFFHFSRWMAPNAAKARKGLMTAPDDPYSELSHGHL